MVLRIPFPNCPLCGQAIGKAIGTFDCTAYPHYIEPLPKTLTWLICATCGHIYTDSYWSAQGLEILLAKAHACQVADGNFEQKRFLWSPVVQCVFAQLPLPERGFDSGISWLDVGCGDGALVMTAAEFGFDAAGLDSRREVIERIAALGYRAVQGDFLQSAVSKPLHVMSMADVLEHFPYPAQALRKAHSMLNPGGLLYVSCPNNDCASWRAMDAASANPYWIEMEHCHNFSRRLLMQLLRECGFNPLHYGISQRYKAGMEIVSRRTGSA